MKRIFLGATAAAIAALTQQNAEAAKPSETLNDQKPDGSLAPPISGLPDAISAKAPTTYTVGTEMFGFVIDRSEAGELFAYHTSHVSHASHRSHSSHYSAR